jgi:steroid delta-isomerase-like uncharacterized protein
MRTLFVGVLAALVVGCAAFSSSTTRGDQAMTLEHNKAIVRGYLTTEVLSTGDPAALQRYFSEDVVFNGSRDVNPQLARMRALRRAFPDLHVTVEDQIAEGDKVVTRVIFRGTHQGEFRGIAPTGKRVEYSGIAIDRIANGKVVEMWHLINALGLLDQIGAAVPKQ